MTRSPHKHGMPRKTGRNVLVFLLVTLAAVALALGVRAIWPAKAAPAEDVTGAPVASDVDAAGGGGATPPAPPIPSATPAPKPDPVSAPPGVITKELATTMVTGFVSSVTAIDPLSVDVPEQLSTVARGTILAEVENQAEELRANGWTLSGAPVVKSVSIISSDLTATPATAIARACIDSSKVETLDAAGKPVGGPTDSPPALNLYTLQQDAGVWRVVARTFPNDPTC